MSHCGLHCLKIENIGVALDGQTLLEQVCLHAHCGQLTAIVGRNGAGKSTLLKAVLGEIPHTGTVTFSGHNGTPLSEHKPRIGYVPQKLDLDRNSPVTVYDLLLSLSSRYPAFLPRPKRLVSRFSEHLARFDAAALLDSPLGKLSGGERQRVLLAAAILPMPDLLILDEPVAGVDQNGMAELYRLLDQLKKEDMVILMVSHDLDYVRKNADRVVLLDKTVEASGTPDAVFASAAFQKAFGEGKA